MGVACCRVALDIHDVRTNPLPSSRQKHGRPVNDVAALDATSFGSLGLRCVSLVHLSRHSMWKI